MASHPSGKPAINLIKTTINSRPKASQVSATTNAGTNVFKSRFENMEGGEITDAEPEPAHRSVGIFPTTPSTPRERRPYEETFPSPKRSNTDSITSRPLRNALHLGSEAEGPPRLPEPLSRIENVYGSGFGAPAGMVTDCMLRPRETIYELTPQAGIHHFSDFRPGVILSTPTHTHHYDQSVVDPDKPDQSMSRIGVVNSKYRKFIVVACFERHAVVLWALIFLKPLPPNFTY